MPLTGKLPHPRQSCGGASRELFCASIYNVRQAGHQQLASTPGTATTGANVVHQQGPSSASAMAQPKVAQQRLQTLMG